MPEKQYLSVAALIPHQADILRELAHLISHHECDILDWHQHTHGDRISLSFLIGAPWSVIAKLEPKLSALSKKYALQIVMERTQVSPPTKNTLPYLLYIISEDHPENFHQIMRFLSQQEIFVQEIFIDSYKARYTETAMHSFTIKIQFSVNLSISDWRERFMLFCDDMNFDAIMEPEKM